MTDRAHPPAAPDDGLRDAQVDALWAATRSDGPSPAIDATLQAAARRAVGAGPQRDDKRVPEATRPESWWAPLAAAAAIGAVALGLLQLLPDERSERAVVSDMPAPAERKAIEAAGRAKVEPPAEQRPAAPAAVTQVPVPAPIAAAPVAAPQVAQQPTGPPLASPKPASPAPASAAPAVSAPAARSRTAAAEAPPVAAPEADRDQQRARKDAPVPFPLEAAPQRETSSPPAADAGNALLRGPADRRNEAVTGERARASALTDKLATPGTPPAAALPPPAVPAAAPAPPASAGAVGGAMPLAKTMKKQESDDAAKSDMRTPEERIALIRRLRDERKFDEAAKELAAFRAAYADAERMLPPDLRDWRLPPGLRQ